MIEEKNLIDKCEQRKAVFVPNQYFFTVFVQLKERSETLDDLSRKQYEALVELTTVER